MTFIRCVVFATVAAVASSAHVSEVLMTQATLFGGLDKECTPNATTTCEVNMVEAVSWVRAIKAGGTPAAFLPTLDRSHILTMLHPKDWGANFALHKKLGNTRGFLSSMGFPSEPTLATFKVRESDPRVLDSFDFPTPHNFRDVTTARMIDAATSLLLVAANRRFKTLDSVAKTAATTMEWADVFNKKDGLYKNTLAVVSGSTVAEFSNALVGHGARPEIICRVDAAADSVEFNGTWLVNVKTTKTHLHRIQIHRLSSTSSTIVNVTLIAQPLELPAANRTDPQYVADRAMMKAEALIAAANNPIQGSTAGPMPASTGADGAVLCRRGECAMGNLWADAIRNVTGTDIAFFSGSWIAGPGWAAGNVYLRDIYNSYPFIELAGKVTVLGLSLFELWNQSIALHAFDPYRPMSGEGWRHLPQVSGMRVKYNLARANVNDRLISIEVWDKEHNEYRPLERLKTYSVSGPQYLMESSQVHSKHLLAGYTGEVSFSPINQNVQNLMSQFMARTAGQYVPGIFGRIIEDNSSAISMMSWNHKVSGCQADFTMDSSINTCVACPVGTSRAVGAAACAPVTSSGLSSTVLIAIVAGCCVLALIVAIAAFFGVMRWKRYQRTRYCPKDPSLPIAAFFVTVRNEVAIREQYSASAHAAFKCVEDVVSKAANDHKCFVARRLGAHFLVVGSDAADAVRAAARVQEAVASTVWVDVLSAQRLRGGPASGPTTQTQSYAASSAQAPSQSASQTASARSAPSILMPPSSDMPMQLPTSSTRAPDLISVSAGMAFGTAIITADEVFDTWLYSGPVVDAAAAVADAARPGQFLAMQPLVTASEHSLKTATGDGAAAATLNATFEQVVTRKLPCPLKVGAPEADVALFQVDAAGCPHRMFEALSCGEPDNAGALTAALEVAAGGLTSRTVGAVCWAVPALKSPKAFASRAEQAKEVEAILNALATVCRVSDADLIYAIDGTFLAVVNGSAARTAQVATTTVALARDGVAAVQEDSRLHVVAAIATGLAMVGPMTSAVVVAGVAAERAKLLATVAVAQYDKTVLMAPKPRQHETEIPPEVELILAPSDIFTDLDPYYVLAGVNAIVWPDHCVPLQSSMRCEPVSLFAVVREKDIVPEGEWLYQLASAQNPYAASNAALYRALSGQLDVADHGSPSPMDNAPHESEPAARARQPRSFRGYRRDRRGNNDRDVQQQPQALYPSLPQRCSDDLQRLIFDIDAEVAAGASRRGSLDGEQHDLQVAKRGVQSVVQAHTQRLVVRFTQ